MVTTVAFEKSFSKISPWIILALPETPALAAFWLESATISGVFDLHGPRAE